MRSASRGVAIAYLNGDYSCGEFYSDVLASGTLSRPRQGAAHAGDYRLRVRRWCFVQCLLFSLSVTLFDEAGQSARLFNAFVRCQ